jgi:hypothetical protein
MKTKYTVMALMVVALLSGCHKIYYHKAGPMVANKNSATVNEWHHIGVVGLVEFSDPTDLKNYCGSAGWRSVETENSFLTGLVSGLTYGLYTPRMANVMCK